jgi:hypothetical protein
MFSSFSVGSSRLLCNIISISPNRYEFRLTDGRSPEDGRLAIIAAGEPPGLPLLYRLAASSPEAAAVVLPGVPLPAEGALLCPNILEYRFPGAFIGTSSLLGDSPDLGVLLRRAANVEPPVRGEVDANGGGSVVGNASPPDCGDEEVVGQGRLLVPPEVSGIA